MREGGTAFLLSPPRSILSVRELNRQPSRFSLYVLGESMLPSKRNRWCSFVAWERDFSGDRVGPRHISAFVWLFVGRSPECAAKVLTVISTDELLTHANAVFFEEAFVAGSFQPGLDIHFHNGSKWEGRSWRKCNAVICVSALITRSCMKRNSTFDTLLLLFTPNWFCLCLWLFNVHYYIPKESFCCKNKDTLLFF